MKKIISLLISIIIISTCLFSGVVNVSASGRGVIAFSKKNVEVDETLTVTVSVSATEAMYAVQFALKYDPDVLKFQSGDSCSGGAGVLTVVEALDGVSSKSFNYTFKAVKAGSCYVSTADGAYVNENYEEISLSNQGATVRVKDIALSSNANLKSLKVSKGSLSPKFSSSTTLYKVNVKNSVTDCNVYATAEDADAKVDVDGGSKLKVGENTCRVTVTAANGNQKIYKIVITREEKEKEESVDKKPTESKKPTSSKESVSSKPTSSEESVSSEEIDSSVESETSDVSEESSELETSSEEETSEDDASGISVENIEVITEKTETTKKKYTMPNTLKDIDIPKGFELSIVSFNGEEVEVAKDKNEDYVLYYVKNTKTKDIEPYVLDDENQVLKKLQYIEQDDRYYIFAQVPSDFSLPTGYYPTGSLISDFNINCYASDNPELADFYYMYCFNGKDYEFYRYDTEEKVIQRYPELDMVASVENEVVEDEDNLINRFSSLTTNAKIVVLGTTALILFALLLVVLLIFKILAKRNQAAMVNDWDYDSFDNVEIDNGFGSSNGGFLTEDDDDSN